MGEIQEDIISINWKQVAIERDSQKTRILEIEILTIWLSKLISGTSLAVQWLGLRASTAGSVGLIPGQETKTPHAVWCDQKKKINFKIPQKSEK